MGFWHWAWKHSATRRFIKGPPKPKPTMATVGGVTHRLIWADRNAGWRYRCTCGWIDPEMRWTESHALYEGNRHVRSPRRRSTVPQPGVEAQLTKAMKDISTRIDAFARLPKEKDKAWRQDPEFARGGWSNSLKQRTPSPCA